MRGTRVYVRLVKRAVLVLPMVWILYSVYELSTTSGGHQFDNVPPHRELERAPADTHHLFTPKPTKKSGVHSQKPSALSHEQNRNRDEPTDHPNLSPQDSATTHRQGYSQQLQMMIEMGGRLVEKRPAEEFAGVVLPPINNRTDPEGPGENGQGVNIDVKLLSSEEKILFDRGWALNGFNQYASDQISIYRSLPDGRSVECRDQALTYPQPFQEISVVIIFHNEAWSVLLRSVHSVLSRTPQNILREVILVDDYSTSDYLQAPLEKYFNPIPLVKIVRATRRQGLTRARLLGFYVSSAPIVVFLDSHIECFPGWAEPLINRISQDHTRVVFPSIEVINDGDLKTSSNTDVSQYGIFSMKDLTFQWANIPASETSRRTSNADPIRSPTMPGGLFAISREFFHHLGAYDPGLDYWGGENIELSFKAWMCGGSVELVTCSHVGHIFRRTNPIKWTHNIGNKNSIRVAEVWMDDYKNYFFERILYDLNDYGDVSDRKALRNKLQCHNFQWYVRNVYPELELPLDVRFAGEIRSQASPRCLDSMGAPEQNQPSPRLYPCHGQGYNQFWYLGQVGRIFQDNWQVCYLNGQVLGQHQCVDSSWTYTEEESLQHQTTSLCLTAAATGDDLSLAPCVGNVYQKWKLQTRRQDLNFPH